MKAIDTALVLAREERARGRDVEFYKNEYGVLCMKSTWTADDGSSWERHTEILDEDEENKTLEEEK